MTAEDVKEERRRRKRLAKLRFRSLVTKTILNRFWLSELEEQKLGDNVKRNVAIIVRRKGKKSILSLRDKAILNKAAEYRTEEEKRKLVNIIIDLPCFKTFSPVIRSRLSKVVYYQYYGPGRVILREGHACSCIYFILDGEVTLYRKSYLSAEESWVDVPINAMGPGEMFGEVGLLENRTRFTTSIAATDLELLCVYKEDFDEILRETLTLRWDQIKLSLKRFDYFKSWTDDQIRECCMLSQIKEFAPLQTVYAEDKGRLNFVFFLLSGSCTILQCLKMKFTMKGKQKRYELLALELAESASQQLLQQIHKVADDLRENYKSSVSEGEKQATRESIRQSIKEIHTDFLRKSTEKTDKLDYRKGIVAQNHECKFVEVGSFSCGSVFGLGEEMLHRSIVARTSVQVLLIPRYWLFQKKQNVGNVWQRTKTYLNSSIPSRQKIFDDFKSTNRWKKYKEQLINEINSSHNANNSTNLADVPVICRIEEGY